MRRTYRRTSGYRPSGYDTHQPSRRRSTSGLVVAAMVLFILAAAGAGVVAVLKMGGSGGERPANASASAVVTSSPLGDNTYRDGVSVDGVPLGGLTRDAAVQKVAAAQQQFVRATGVTVADPNGGQTKLMLSDLPQSAVSFDTEEILNQAWNLGREGNNDRERRASAQKLKETPVQLMTTVTVDPSSFEQKVRALTEPFYKEAQNAQVNLDAYDVTKTGTDRLAFVPESAGQQVNADRLWESVRAAFANRTFAEVRMELETVAPQWTEAVLRANLKLLAISPISAGSARENKTLNDANVGHTFTTQIFDHSKERLTNIRLAGKAVSGLLLPGEIFSMNERTGNRTAAQGYQVAPIDRSGVVDRGLGGGVCQVSGTLYNAAVRYGGKYESGGEAESTKDQPGLAITDRDSHSLPSAYLHTGTDATVDIASKKDLKFRNDCAMPVIIVMYYEKTANGKYFEHCDIYGPALPDGATYDLLRKNAKVLPADTTTPAKTVYSKYATPGAPVYIKPRAGYTVDIYIEKNVNGQKTETRSYSASYKAQPAFYYVFTGETAPTTTPSTTPTDGASTDTPVG